MTTEEIGEILKLHKASVVSRYRFWNEEVTDND